MLNLTFVKNTYSDMKQTDFIKHRSIAILMFTAMLTTIVFFQSCSKDDENNIVDNDYFISSQKLISYTSSGINNQFEALMFLYPDVEDLLPSIKYDVDVYKIVYKTPFQGETIEASGLVCIPSCEGETFPVISFQNGTNTAHAEAPTEDYLGILFRYLESSASMGYIVIIPDYIGFGSSNEYLHPYLHKQSTVTSVENIILATGEMIDKEESGVEWNNDVYLMGYSQGGWATMCTHKYLVEQNEQEFVLKASSCGAGPYDLNMVEDFMLSEVTYEQPVYMAYTMVSYKNLGLITNPLTDFFNEPYASLMPSLFDGSMTNEQINEQLNDTVAVLLTDEFLNGEVVSDLNWDMNENSVTGWNTEQPVHLYHGTADMSVPIQTTEQIYSEFTDFGATANVSYFPLEDMDHSMAAIPMVIESLTWFNDIKKEEK